MHRANRLTTSDYPHIYHNSEGLGDNCHSLFDIKQVDLTEDSKDQSSPPGGPPAINRPDSSERSTSRGRSRFGRQAASSDRSRCSMRPRSRSGSSPERVGLSQQTPEVNDQDCQAKPKNDYQYPKSEVVEAYPVFADGSRHINGILVAFDYSRPGTPLRQCEHYKKRHEALRAQHTVQAKKTDRRLSPLQRERAEKKAQKAQERWDQMSEAARDFHLKEKYGEYLNQVKHPPNDPGDMRAVVDQEGRFIGAMGHPKGKPRGFAAAWAEPLSPEGRRQIRRARDRYDIGRRQSDLALVDTESLEATRPRSNIVLIQGQSYEIVDGQKPIPWPHSHRSVYERDTISDGVTQCNPYEHIDWRGRPMAPALRRRLGTYWPRWPGGPLEGLEH